MLVKNLTESIAKDIMAQKDENGQQRFHALMSKKDVCKYTGYSDTRVAQLLRGAIKASNKHQRYFYKDVAAAIAEECAKL